MKNNLELMGIKNDPIIEKIFEELYTKDGMINAYCAYLPNKTRAQGEMMAERIEQTVNYFYRSYDLIKADPARANDIILDRLTEDCETDEERAKVLYDFLTEYATVLAESDEQSITPEKKQLLDDFRNLAASYTPGEEADENTCKDLRELIKKAFSSSHPLFRKAIEATEKAAEDLPNAEFSLTASDERSAVMAAAMSVYINSKLGTEKSIAHDAFINSTIYEITLAVCAQYEAAKVIASGEKNDAAWEITAEILSGIYCLTITIGYSLGILAAYGYGVLLALESGLNLLAIILASLAMVGVFYVFDDSENDIADISSGLGEVTARVIRFAVKAVVSGAKKVMEYFGIDTGDDELIQQTANDILEKVTGGVYVPSQSEDNNEGCLNVNTASVFS